MQTRPARVRRRLFEADHATKVAGVLVVTRLRAPSPDPAAAAELRTGLHRALEVLAAKPRYVGGEVGRNVDDPGHWVLCTLLVNVGSYRRAL